MITPPEGSGPLNGQKVLGFLDDADGTVISGIGAKPAGIVLGNAETDGTEPHPGHDVPKTVSQGSGVVGGFQKMKGEAQGGFLANSRQLLQFREQP